MLLYILKLLGKVLIHPQIAHQCVLDCKKSSPHLTASFKGFRTFGTVFILLAIGCIAFIDRSMWTGALSFLGAMYFANGIATLICHHRLHDERLTSAATAH